MQSPSAEVMRRAGGVIGARSDDERRWQHPWLRVQRFIRTILAVRRDEVTRPVMKATLVEALREREKIKGAGWMN